MTERETDILLQSADKAQGSFSLYFLYGVYGRVTREEDVAIEHYTTTFSNVTAKRLALLQSADKALGSGVSSRRFNQEMKELPSLPMLLQNNKQLFSEVNLEKWLPQTSLI